MNALWTVAAATGAALFAVSFGDVVSEELRARLDQVPERLIAHAGRRLEPEIRAEVTAEWSAELRAILHRRGALPLPITRLAIGIHFAVGLLVAGRKISRILSAAPSAPRHARPRTRPGRSASLPVEPQSPSKRPLPLMASLAPVVVGVAFFLMTRSPSFLLLTLFGPAVLAGSWLTERRGRIRDGMTPR